MKRSLQEESEKLARSWMQHEPAWLRDYLVAGVEDPRINLQSILTRHFLIRALVGEQFGGLMQEEYRFSAAMNWLLKLGEQTPEAEGLQAVLFGLRRGVDNVEGIEIPAWLRGIFNSVPAVRDGIPVPNYVENFLEQNPNASGSSVDAARAWNTIAELWKEVLRLKAPAKASQISVLEPACGSATDYRFLEAYGIAPRIDYFGFDLCLKNVENARALFPAAHFEPGNVFEISSADKAFDYCIVHDLFEHLSFEGLAQAVAEICRVTRHGICVGFFQMDEIAEHVLRPVDEYHWNLLSLARMKALFAEHGFAAQVLQIATFLRQMTGCPRTHNPNAYTLMLVKWVKSG